MVLDCSDIMSSRQAQSLRSSGESGFCSRQHQARHSLEEIVLTDETDVVTGSFVCIGDQSLTLNVVDDAGDALTCERCPLILPDMHQYWGVVGVNQDG